MDIKEKLTEVAQTIRKITPLTPEMFYQETTHNITVAWRDGEIPSEEETAKLEVELKAYGRLVPTYYRDLNYVSFLILV